MGREPFISFDIKTLYISYEHLLFFFYLIIDPSHQMSGFRNAEGFAYRYLLTQFVVYAFKELTILVPVP